MIWLRVRYVVAYDISDDKRLRKVYKTMCGYGDPLQYSVFRCDLNAREKVELISALTEIIHHREDRVLIIDLGPASGRADERMETLGRSDLPPVRRAIVV